MFEAKQGEQVAPRSRSSHPLPGYPASLHAQRHEQGMWTRVSVSVYGTHTQNGQAAVQCFGQRASPQQNAWAGLSSPWTTSLTPDNPLTGSSGPSFRCRRTTSGPSGWG